MHSFATSRAKRVRQLQAARLARRAAPVEVGVAAPVVSTTTSERKLAYGAGLVDRGRAIEPESGTESDGANDRVMETGSSASDDDNSDDSAGSGEQANGPWQCTVMMVERRQLCELVQLVACASCHAVAMAVRFVNRNLGLVCGMEMFCTSCGHISGSALTSGRVSGAANAQFSVIRQTVSAFMDMGVGRSGVDKLGRYLDMPSVHHRSFVRHSRAVSAGNQKVVKRVFDDAAAVVRRTYVDADPALVDAPVIDLTVSFDGSWMKRGHRSLYGTGCVIDVPTGLDTVVLSLYCQQCAYASTSYGGKGTVEFAEWYRSHAAKCSANYTGSSGGMEVKAAEVMWSRSLARGFRYTTVVSDGDTRTFKHLQDLRVYGDVEITKEECVNHVAKRLGTALRNLLAQGRKSGVTLGGRGYGKLTGEVVKRLTLYYGMAVRRHKGDLQGMRRAVLATLDHCSSTDDAPNHDRCPEGDTSWCFFHKAEAKGEEPGPHRENLATPLCAEVADVVRAVYTRLSDNDLLKRCLLGATQNANESLHAAIWAKCPKTSFVGLERVIAATSSAISEFNCGVKTTIECLCDVMGTASGSQLLASAEKADHRRVRQARRQAAAATREARRARQIALARAADVGAADYAAGAF